MITRKEVAELAGVSLAAVSRVVNNSGYVRQDKREAIEKAIRELGYRPNPLAVAMRTQQTRHIMFCAGGVNSNYSFEVYEGVSRYAREHGYTAILCKDFDHEDFHSLMVDGVIMPNEMAANTLLQDKEFTLPMPMVYASFGSAVMVPKRIPAIEVDTYRAMEMGIEYLLSKGHRKIALATPFNLDETNPRSLAWKNMMTPVLTDRLEDYVFLMDQDKLSLKEEPEEFCVYGNMLAEKFVQRQCDATAVICFNDSLAAGLMQGLRRHHIRVPDDVSIVGIDASTLGKLVYPPLTSVSLSPLAHGKECARILIEIIENRNASRKTHIPISLVEGQSVRTLK